MNLLRADQSTLTVDQWNLLSNLSHCYDGHAGFSIGEQYMFGQNNLPHKLRFKSATIEQLFHVLLDATQPLYKNNRDFLSLSADDRSVLLGTTLTFTASISTNFIFYKIRLMEHSAYYDAVQMMTSTNLVPIAKRFPARLNFDVNVMKLFLAILSFSTFRCIAYPHSSSDNLSNIQEIVRIQDRYIEITWRYLLYTYDHERAVKSFSDFIRCIFVVNEGVVEAQEHHWYQETIDSIAEKTEQSLSLND